MEETVVTNVDWGALNWTAIVAATIFALAQFFAVAASFFSRRRGKRNLAKALLAEVLAHHERDLIKDYVKVTVDKANLLSPVLKSYESHFVYSANIVNLGMFPKEIVSDIVRLYHVSTSIDGTVDVIFEGGFKNCELLVKEAVVESINSRRLEQRDLAKKVSSALARYVA